ncbi:MAG TPA: phosphate acetyltransferase [Clostridiales bacterium]|nr:phosphate acetyltransferase [Clostridiales bacterium]
MSLMEKITEKAKSQKKTILLPEGSEPRTIQAAGKIAKLGIADVVLLGNEAEIKKGAQESGTDITGVRLIDPATSPKLDEYAALFYELRKSKGVTPEQAKEICKDTLYFAVTAIKNNDADGMVSGAIHSTGDTLRPALQVLKTRPGVSIVSSSFIMELPDGKYGDDGVLIFADCAINIDPNADELAAIAIASADTASGLAGMEPRVAMLSFSTKGSAKHELVDKVQAATAKVKELAPTLNVDGELQADAALVESVGQLKSPGSPVAGKANVLVFPGLEAGNIGYKLVQRMAGAEAIGPICQGMAKPVNDLSRGCSVEDIVNVVAITALQAQN